MIFVAVRHDEPRINNRIEAGENNNRKTADHYYYGDHQV
jgi:hypothetical protein